jgi:predicted phage terminase large subunit-like protein
MARSSPAGLLTVASAGRQKKWLPYRHHRAINRELLKVAAGETRLLILSVPVRHGKTTLGSVGMSAWWLGLNPDDNVVEISHTSQYATDNIGRPARQLFAQMGDAVFGQTIDRRSDASNRWSIAGRAGGFYCDGIDGSIEGRGIDLAIIDDPIGNLADANSPKARAQLWEIYTNQILPRMSPKGAVIVIMSRWNRDDFVQQLIDAGNAGEGEIPKILDLPAIALEHEEYPYSDGDVLGRKPGEALWPEVRPIEFLERMRRGVGSWTFAARFQGRPEAAGGNVIKRAWFRYFELEGSGAELRFVAIDNIGGTLIRRTIRADSCRWRQYVDLAISLKKEADYFVVSTVAIDPVRQDIFVVNIYRAHEPGPAQIPRLVQQWQTWRPSRIKIEAVAYQQKTVEDAVAKGLPAFPINRGSADKLTRANYLAVRYEQGAVFHSRGAGWLAALEDELAGFPKGKDDQVDTLADAANDLLDDDADGDAGATGAYLEVTSR